MCWTYDENMNLELSVVVYSKELRLQRLYIEYYRKKTGKNQTRTYTKEIKVWYKHVKSWHTWWQVLLSPCHIKRTSKVHPNWKPMSEAPRTYLWQQYTKADHCINSFSLKNYGRLWNIGLGHAIICLGIYWERKS